MCRSGEVDGGVTQHPFALQQFQRVSRLADPFAFADSQDLVTDVDGVQVGRTLAGQICRGAAYGFGAAAASTSRSSRPTRAQKSPSDSPSSRFALKAAKTDTNSATISLSGTRSL